MKRHTILLWLFFWLPGASFGLDGKPVAKLDKAEAKEISGFTRAAKTGEYWGIRDRGNHPMIFRFDQNGSILQKVLTSSLENE